MKTKRKLNYMCVFFVIGSIGVLNSFPGDLLLTFVGGFGFGYNLFSIIIE